MWLYLSINQMVYKGIKDARRKNLEQYTPVRVKTHEQGNAVTRL